MATTTSVTSVTSHGVRDAVVSCIDYRFRPLIAAWIKDELHDQADLIAVAGAGKTLLDAASQQYILGLLKIARDLHGVTTIHILNHLDCGAYGGSKLHATEETEKQFHADQCSLAEQIITQQFPDAVVKRYIVDFSGVHAVVSVSEPATA
jgi:carbonic anhydrase